MQNSAKITKFRRSEHIFGNFSLQASIYIRFQPKVLNFRRKVLLFVGGQKELTLVTLTQKSAKITKFRPKEHIFSILAFKHLVTSIPNQN